MPNSGEQITLVSEILSVTFKESVQHDAPLEWPDEV